LLTLLMMRLHLDENSGVKHLANDIFLKLLDTPPPGLEQTPELEKITELFYVRFADQFFAPLVEEAPKGHFYSDSESLLRIILADLLAQFVGKHGALARGFLTDKSFMRRTFHLFYSRNKFLHLLPVRLLRAALAQNSQLLAGHVIAENLLDPIVSKFLENGSKYNLFNSAVIELFAFICKDNQRSMMKYYMDQFHERLKDVDYVDTFLEIKHKWESLERSESTPDASPAHGRLLDPARDQFVKKVNEEDEEERWMSSDESSAPSLVGSEIDVEEDARPPPLMSPGPPLTLDIIEGDLFPSLLADLAPLKRKRDDEDDDFFEHLRKKPKTDEKK